MRRPSRNEPAISVVCIPMHELWLIGCDRWASVLTVLGVDCFGQGAAILPQGLLMSKLSAVAHHPVVQWLLRLLRS